MVDRSSIESLIHRDAFSIYSWGTILDSFFSFCLDRKHFSFAPNTLLSLESLYLLIFRPRSSLNLLVSVLNPFFFMHLCILGLGFGFLKFFGVFKIFVKFLGWVGLCWLGNVCSCIEFLLHYNNVSCILDVWLIIVVWVLVGLDWVFTHDAFKFCTSHVHSFFMHMLYLFFPFLVYDVFCSLSLSLSLSPSLSDRPCHGTQTAQIHSDLEPSSWF